MCTSSPAQRIHALKAARHLLDTNQQHYICRALKAVSDRDHSLLAATTELRHFVLGSLQGWNTLGRWLEYGLRRQAAPASPFQYLVYLDGAVMTLARLAWVDKMIHDLKEGC